MDFGWPRHPDAAHARVEPMNQNPRSKTLKVSFEIERRADEPERLGQPYVDHDPPKRSMLVRGLGWLGAAGATGLIAWLVQQLLG